MPNGDQATSGLRVGQPFNPFGMFAGIVIPEALVRSPVLSPGAQLAYGRLARYAGADGKCFPAMATLAAEIGVSERQAQRCITELEGEKLLRRQKRFSGPAQTTNAFEFLWHEVFELGGGDGYDTRPVTDMSPKESQKTHNTDLDYPAMNRKKRDSRLEAGSCARQRKRYSGLREALAIYMAEPGVDGVYPSDRQTVDIVDAACGATEEQVIECLRYLYDERGLRPGTKHGPRQFSWFPTVVGDYFKRKREREHVANPVERAAAKREEAGWTTARVDWMTDAIEIDGSV
jgi:Helix-turn-helix domain